MLFFSLLHLLLISKFSNVVVAAAAVATHLTFYAYVYFTFWTFVNSQQRCTVVFVWVRTRAPLHSFDRGRKKLFDSRSQAVQILRFVSLSTLNKLNVHSEVTFKQLMRLSSYNRDRTTTSTEKRVEYFIWRAELWYACCCSVVIVFLLLLLGSIQFDMNFCSLYVCRWLFDRSNRLIKMFCSMQSDGGGYKRTATQNGTWTGKTVKTLVNVNTSFGTGTTLHIHIN